MTRLILIEDTPLPHGVTSLSPRLNCRVGFAMIAAIEAWRTAHGLATQAEAVRALIDIGLTTEGQKS